MFIFRRWVTEDLTQKVDIKSKFEEGLEKEKRAVELKERRMSMSYWACLDGTSQSPKLKAEYHFLRHARFFI